MRPGSAWITRAPSTVATLMRTSLGVRGPVTREVGCSSGRAMQEGGVRRSTPLERGRKSEQKRAATVRGFSHPSRSRLRQTAARTGRRRVMPLSRPAPRLDVLGFRPDILHFLPGPGRRLTESKAENVGEVSDPLPEVIHQLLGAL